LKKNLHPDLHKTHADSQQCQKVGHGGKHNLILWCPVPVPLPVFYGFIFPFFLDLDTDLKFTVPHKNLKTF